MMDTAAATDQLNSDEPTGKEEASEQPNSECVMVHDDADPKMGVPIKRDLKANLGSSIFSSCYIVHFSNNLYQKVALNDWLRA